MIDRGPPDDRRQLPQSQSQSQPPDEDTPLPLPLSSSQPQEPSLPSAGDDDILDLQLALLDRDGKIRALNDRLTRQQEFIAQLQDSLMQLSIQQCNAALDERQDHHNSPLIAAAQQGDVEILGSMLGDAVVDRDDRRGSEAIDSALMVACQNGCVPAAALLLRHGASVHADHDSSLLWACRTGAVDLVRLLLDHGADPNVLNGCPLRIATRMGFAHVVRELVYKGALAW